MTTERRKRAFLAAYAEVGNITRAAELAGICRDTHFKWMKNDTDGAYAAAFAEAEEQAIERLEAEARRRAVEGVTKPVYQGGKQVGVVQEYSDTLLIFLLKGAKPEKYRENRAVQLTGKDGGPVQVQTFSQLSDAELDEKIRQLAEGVARVEVTE